MANRIAPRISGSVRLCKALLLAAALIGVSFVGIWAVAGFRPAFSMLSTIPYTTSASWTLSSIPMFLLMGYIAYHSGLTRGLFEAARVWWGWLPGGLAIASLAGASGFAAVSGSSVACSAAIGRIAVPEMARQGYDLRIATGSVAAGGTIGALIPPSIILIVYGVATEQSIARLFMAAIVPGILMAVSLVLAWRFVSRGGAFQTLERKSRAEVLQALWKALPALVLPVVVIGGLRVGVFTPTEAAVIAAVYAALVGAFVYGELTLKSFYEGLVEAGKTSRMEYFYREMRRRTGLLMEGDGPAGGDWNFDAENRKALPKGLELPHRMRFRPDDTTQEVLELVAARFDNHFGDLEGFGWAVTRDEALRALRHFIKDCLPTFGDYQDAMKAGEDFLFRQSGVGAEGDFRFFRASGHAHLDLDPVALGLGTNVEARVDRTGHVEFDRPA